MMDEEGWVPTMWIVDLDSLDSAAAHFVFHPVSGTPSVMQAYLPRADWERMGRPGTVRVVVTKETT